MGIRIARLLRKRPTDAESELWRRIRRRQLFGFKFRRQHPLGSYIVDFVCIEQKLVVELDGGQHALREVDDLIRTKRLEERGYRVLRYWNTQIFKEMDAVLEQIGRTLLNE